MVYMGSKARFANEILEIVLKDRKPDQWYVEPFCGGCNVIDKVSGNRWANDLNRYLVAMFDALANKGWQPPQEITKTFYQALKKNRDKFAPHYVGWAGFVGGFRGVFFAGFTGGANKKNEDYLGEQIRNVLRQVEFLKGVKFTSKPYQLLEIPPNSIVYCDPPYAHSSGYSTGGFNHAAFWEWARKATLRGHEVYVSEYNAPDDFECVWSKETKSWVADSPSDAVECLFQLKKVNNYC